MRVLWPGAAWNDANFRASDALNIASIDSIDVKWLYTITIAYSIRQQQAGAIYRMTVSCFSYLSQSYFFYCMTCR